MSAPGPCESSLTKPPPRFEDELRRAVAGEVRFDRLTRAIYSTDASIYEITPLGVVTPRTTADVVATVEVCRRHRVPIVARGAGTGITGGAIGWGVCLDFSRFMHAIGVVDVAARTVTVEPGVVLDDLNARLAPDGLFFPADVATASRATLGGMIANNSAGSHSVYYGRTVDYVAGLTVVLADGSVVEWEHAPYAEPPPAPDGLQVQTPIGLRAAWEARRAERTPLHPPERPSVPPAGAAGPILAAIERVRASFHNDVLERYPRVLRRNGGYALDRLCLSDAPNPATLICGSEGTLGLIVGAKLRLVPMPRCKSLVVLHFADVLEAVRATPRLLAHDPAAVELVDDLILDAGRGQVPAAIRDRFLIGRPRAIQICELYDEDAGRLADRTHRLAHELERDGVGQPVAVVLDPAVQLAVWTLRNKGFGLLMSQPGDAHPLEFIEDAAVDPSRLGDYIAEMDAMLRSEGVTKVGYYAHASVGVIHVRPTLNLRQPADVVRLRRIAECTCDLVHRYGGAMTGEHGDGIIRSEWLERMYGPRIVQAFREIKAAFDPENLLNPRKIVDPLPMDERLRAARRPQSLPVTTHFDYTAHGGLAGLAAMCSGVGQCRQTLVGTMCPSYMATLDEQHTTRARANALRIALTRPELIDGPTDPVMDDVMGLCLSCKACRTECPTGVDMARMKAEWLAMRHRARGVPLRTRVLAAAPRMAELLSPLAPLANAVLRSTPMRALMDALFGIDRRIPPPALARRTFRAWFQARGRDGGRPTPVDQPRGRVVYFPDTWMNFYWPSVGIAAVRLLEAAGFHVDVPPLVCCGRPLISLGLLDAATQLARINVERLSRHSGSVHAIVVGEPSCLSALLDEYPQLVRTEAARRVASLARPVESLLVEALADGAPIGWSTGPRETLLHGHCHQKALYGTADAVALLKSLPGQAREINSGCCGMAGAFGHLREHYDVARAIGQQRLFPAVSARGAAEIAVCGFSCREQIAAHTDVTPRHLLELAADALPK